MSPNRTTLELLSALRMLTCTVCAMFVNLFVLFVQLLGPNLEPSLSKHMASHTVCWFFGAVTPRENPLSGWGYLFLCPVTGDLRAQHCLTAALREIQHLTGVQRSPKLAYEFDMLLNWTMSLVLRWPAHLADPPKLWILQRD